MKIKILSIVFFIISCNQNDRVENNIPIVEEQDSVEKNEIIFPNLPPKNIVSSFKSFPNNKGPLLYLFNTKLDSINKEILLQKEFLINEEENVQIDLTQGDNLILISEQRYQNIKTAFFYFFNHPEGSPLLLIYWHEWNWDFDIEDGGEFELWTFKKETWIPVNNTGLLATIEAMNVLKIRPCPFKRNHDLKSYFCYELENFDSKKIAKFPIINKLHKEITAIEKIEDYDLMLNCDWQNISMNLIKNID